MSTYIFIYIHVDLQSDMKIDASLIFLNILEKFFYALLILTVR